MSRVAICRVSMVRLGPDSKRPPFEADLWAPSYHPRLLRELEPLTQRDWLAPMGPDFCGLHGLRGTNDLVQKRYDCACAPDTEEDRVPDRRMSM